MNSKRLICRPDRVAALLAAVSCVVQSGCEAPMAAIDRHTSKLLIGTSADVGGDALPPALWADGAAPAEHDGGSVYATDDLSTVNPPASAIAFEEAQGDTDAFIARLEGYNEAPTDPIELDLRDSLTMAMQDGREYRFAEEDYVISALRLLSERHLWGPRLSNDTDLFFNADGNNGLYDASLSIINDLRVTQRLPYGGSVSARLLASATEDLHQRVAGENVQSADFILSADVPLLRGAGQAARENRIQSERNVIYAARTFERFRRSFLFDITTDFLNLVVLYKAIENSERQVATLEKGQEREQALVDAGRQEPFQAALAAQSTLGARDDLNTRREVYRVAIDRFKVRLGLPETTPLVIALDTSTLPIPLVEEVDKAVRSAFSNRLDLQNRRDRVDDGRRRVLVARNNLLPDLGIQASVSIPTDPDLDRGGLRFSSEDASYLAGLRLSLPLDREIERLGLREAQIDLERSILDYDRFRDTVALEVRAAVRNIDRAGFSRELRLENVRVSELRLASITAAPDRAEARDRTEAADSLVRARDDLLRADRDLQISVLQYLLDTGQLRVAWDGTLQPLGNGGP